MDIMDTYGMNSCSVSTCYFDLHMTLSVTVSAWTTCTELIKAGSVHFVLEHSVRDATDGLLAKLHGQWNLLTKADAGFLQRS